jgi:hypothetical protein
LPLDLGGLTVGNEELRVRAICLIPAAFVGDSRQCGDVAKVEVS